MVSVSVVIPTFNRKEILPLILEALFEQNYPTDAYEVILVDDGSTDGTGNLVKGLDTPSNFKYIRQTNGGPAKARNTGIKNANGETILFVDDDVVANENLVVSHCKCHSESKGNLAVLGYTPFHPEVIVSPVMRYHAERWKRIFNEIETIQKKDEEIPYYYLISLNVSINRKILEKVGLFDESFTRADCEDTYLGYKLRKNGIKIEFCKKAFAFHYYQTDLNSSCRRNEKNGLQAGRLYKKFPEFKDRFRIDYATYHVAKGTSPFRRIKIFLRRILLNNFSLSFIKYMAKFFEQILPFVVLKHLYALLDINYYSKGVRQGLKESGEFING